MPVKLFHIGNSTKAYSLSIKTDLDLEKVKFSLVMYENLTIVLVVSGESSRMCGGITPKFVCECMFAILNQICLF